MLKRALIFGIGLVGLPHLLGAVPTPIYTVLADTAPGAGDDIYIWGPGNGNSVTLDSATLIPAPPEGMYSMKAQAVSGNGSTWAIEFLNPPDKKGVRSNRGVDLSDYSAGEMRFWANCDSDNFEIFIQNLKGEQEGYSYQGTFNGAFNQWVPVLFPLGPLTAAKVSMKDIESPFEMTALGNVTCYIDNVRYANPGSPGADIFNVNLKSVSGKPASPSNINWTIGTLPGAWTVADQYIEVAVDDMRDLAWGVQIYTDNTAKNANPPYTASISSFTPTPSGLVDTSNTTAKLPLAWATRSDISTVTVVAAEPNNNGVEHFPLDPNAFQWFYTEDRAQVAVPNKDNPLHGISAFSNGDPYITVAKNAGIHYAQDPSQFGATVPPFRIYLEGDFSAALAQKTYQTTTLTVEFFNL